MKCLSFRRVLQVGDCLEPFGMRLSGQPPSWCDIWHDPSGVCHLVPSWPQSKAEGP